LAQAGFIVLFSLMLGGIGYEMQHWQRRREVREDMARILRELEEKGFDR
jgi:hypothetical protein